MVVGLAIFLGLAVGCRLLYDQTENRLLHQRANEASSSLQLTVNQVKAPLDAAAKLATATDGDASAFAKIIQPYLGTKAGQTFTSAALYRIGSTTPTTTVGAPIVLPADGANSATSMLSSATTNPFVVVNLLADGRHLGYAVADAAKNPQWVVYGERTLAADPNIRRQTGEPFAQLDYAIYLGTQPTTDHLLGASVRNLPITGRSAQQVTAFGDSNLLIVMTPIGHLSGGLFANLWWIVACGGVLLSAAFALLTRRLLDRHTTALELAKDNERLYDEQRHIAETLQLGLLPQHLVVPEGVSVAARYWPAGAANLIGGDFYDLFAVDDQRWGLAIGDVCGKGIEAAALTGLARHTLRAAARHSTSPTDVLLAVHQALRDHRPATFCTACFAFISQPDPDSLRVELSLGGHPQPLLRHADGRVEAVGTLGMLLGMIEPTITTTVVELEPGDTFVFYTDGLTDAPAEQAVTVEELAALLQLEGDQPIEQLADTIRAVKRGRRPLGSGDDTAILILRFDGVSTASTVKASATGDEPATSSVPGG
jgi:serine phosphatase RsbU (regulator of sigma subunit)